MMSGNEILRDKIIQNYLTSMGSMIKYKHNSKEGEGNDSRNK